MRSQTWSRTLLHWLKKRLYPRPLPVPEWYVGPYKVFTTEFDRETSFKDAPSAADFREYRRSFLECYLDDYLETFVPEYEPAAAHLVASLAGGNFDDIAVTFLLDHSGSLAGEKACLMAATVGVASESLTRLNIRHEILGFTTRTWRGGESQKQWTASGQPPAPGRLCDLLHIIYREFQASEPIEYDGLRLMTEPRILKENVDGEAIDWAVARLSKESAARRILIVISDGAPVDDSTLRHNGPNILDDHLKLTTRNLIASQAAELYGVGLHYRMHRYYPHYLTLANGLDIGGLFLPVLQAILSSPSHAPYIDPTPTELAQN